MASYTVYISFTGGKGASAEFRYPTTSSNTGTGHTSTNRLQLVAGDTVTFAGVPGSLGGGDISGFASGFWTDTADISYIGSISPFVFGTKTVASGTSGTDDITVAPTLVGVTDNFYFEKVAPPITAPTASNVTVDDPQDDQYTATFTLSAPGNGGQLQYAIEKNDSTPDNWTNATSDTQTTFTATFSRTSSPGTIYAQARRSVTDTSSIVSVAGRGFISPDLDTQPGDEFMGYGSSSVPITLASTTSGETYQLRNLTGTAQYQSATASGSSLTITQTSGLPALDTTVTYSVYALKSVATGGSGSYVATGDTYTIERAPTPSDAPTSRDHCKSEWVCMVNSTNRAINYTAPNPGTLIKKRTSGGTVSTIVDLSANTAPTSGATTGTDYEQGAVFYGEKSSNGDPEAVYFFGGGNQQESIVPTSLKGQKFVSYNNRNAPATHYIWSDTTQEIFVYDNISGGIKTGNPTSKISLTANIVSTYQTSTLSAYVWFTGSSDFVMSKTSNGADRNIMAPMSDAVYSSRRFSSFPGIAEDGANGSNVSGTYYAADATDQIMRHGIGDGSGSDSESALGTQNLSDVYLWGQVLSDFVIVAPFTGTIICERWAGSLFNSKWIVEEVFQPTGTATSPTAYIRAAVDGFGVQSNITSGALGSPLYFSSGATIWRWRGTGNFYLRNNYITDEEMVLGYTKDFDDTFDIVGPNTIGYANEFIEFTLTNGTTGTTNYNLNPNDTNRLNVTGTQGLGVNLGLGLDGGSSTDSPDYGEIAEYDKAWVRSDTSGNARPQGALTDNGALIKLGRLGAISFLNENNATANTTYTAFDQIQGIGTTYNLDGTVSNDTITVKLEGGTGTFATNTTSTVPASGNFTTADKVISNNEYVFARVTAPANQGQTQTVTLGFYENSFSPEERLQLTSFSATVPYSTNADDFNIKIFDTDGSTSVLSEATRYIKVLKIEEIATISQGNSTLITCDTTDLTTSNSDLLYYGNDYDSQQNYSVSIESTGVRITAVDGPVYAAKVFVIRY